MKTVLKCIILITLLFAACTSKDPDRAPDNKEIYNYFLKQMKQTATASGYQKYKLVINNIKQTVPLQCPNPDKTMVTCFGVTVDRTEYYDNYTGRYTTIITNDVYRFYRDEYGQLAVADHTAGQTNTEQKQRGWQGNSF
jgi:hypothetical protein